MYWNILLRFFASYYIVRNHHTHRLFNPHGCQMRCTDSYITGMLFSEVANTQDEIIYKNRYAARTCDFRSLESYGLVILYPCTFHH